MWPSRYFAPRYFAARYFRHTGAPPAVFDDTVDYTTIWIGRSRGPRQWIIQPRTTIWTGRARGTTWVIRAKGI